MVSGRTEAVAILREDGAHDVLPRCHSRREFNLEEGVYFCAHPLVHIAQQLVTTEVCLQCRRWLEPKPQTLRDFPTKLHMKRNGPCMYLGEEIGLRDCPTCQGNIKLKEFRCHHAAHDTTTIGECRKCFDYEPRLERRAIKSWAVGITTAPRRESTLQPTLLSLARSGWSEGCIFAEPDSDEPTNFIGFTVTRRGTRAGAWPNWYLGLAELYMRFPFADAYFMVQDDVLFCRNIREFLEQTLWNTTNVGLVSLYSPLSYASSECGFREIESREGILGALAYVLPNSSVRRLLADSQLIEHRLRGASGLTGIDTTVGKWAHCANLPVYVHFPSLAQHIGKTSTLWPTDSDHGQRAGGDFVGEEFDALALIPASESNQNRR